MPAPVPTLGRNRWRRAALVLLCAGVLGLFWIHRQQLRRERLVDEIIEAGGSVVLGRSAWNRLWDNVRGVTASDPVRVTLSPGTSREWLTSWNDLTEISIGELEVEEGADLGPELAQLVARHPLEILQAAGATGADDIAAALSDKRTLHGVHLRGSDLTDAGLRRLPLEQLRTLNIAGTRITADGFGELRRLPPNSMLVLDGNQVTTETIAVLEQNPNPYRLWLYGPDVTDDTLRTLISTLGETEDRKMMGVYLGQTSITESTVLEMQRDQPVSIMHTRDPEPGRPLRWISSPSRQWMRWFGR